MNDLLEPPDEPWQALPMVASGVSARCRLGTAMVDVDDYSDFYRMEIRALVNFLVWMGAGVTDAADLAQETMIDAYRSWQSIQFPRAWIRKVASRKHARRRFDQHETTIEGADDHNPLLAATADIGAWEQRHTVLQLLTALPWRQRQVMAWSFDGYSPQEIANELAITPETVRSNLRLARRALAARLSQARETP